MTKRMENIPIIVQHGGHWEENISYIGFKVFGLLLPTELKKREIDFSKYPLCITTESSDVQVSSTFNNHSETTVEIGQVGFQITEAESSNKAKDITVGLNMNTVTDYVDYAKIISEQMVDIPIETEVDQEIIHERKDEVITDKHHPQISEFQIYKYKETFNLVLNHYAINNNFQFKVKKSFKRVFLVECIDNNCKWILCASRNGNTNQFIIRRFVNNHSCALDVRFKGQRQAITSIITDTIKSKFINIKTTYTVADIIRDMRNDHNINVNYNKAWRSKEKALKNMRGNAIASYAELYTYLFMLHNINVGSIIELQLTTNSCFIKAYGGREDMLFVSDRHESIIKGASKVYPEVPNVFCIFHLLGNIKTKFKKNLKRRKEEFLSAANAYSVKKFNYHMEELEKVDKRVQLYLQEIGYKKWAKVYSTNNRYSNMTSNVAESLNFVITSIRELPICTMLESLRGLIQQWSWKNRHEATSTTTHLTRKYEELLKINYNYSMDLTVHPTNEIFFEVHNKEKKYVVDLSKRTCSCNRFQMDNMPCSHAIVVLKQANMDLYEYLSKT
ncbi:uncharacterized protein LOC141659199 [Apium graveolens]|uniref:uncharacterized protein LOC141659199 n=1 Tax=Apium graveolens TaxID=4045 RepID=UPI003D7A6209